MRGLPLFTSCRLYWCKMRKKRRLVAMRLRQGIKACVRQNNGVYLWEFFILS
jgi:hypothetical protein